MLKRTPVIAIFDIGKTNKKIVLFNDDYKIVFEQSIQFEEIIDDDGDPCDDILRLRNWVQDFMYILTASEEFDLKAVNFSAYGASFVHLDDEGNILTALYNYLKSYPEDLQKKFYHKFNREQIFSLQTASPVMGNLNSGMQLYRLKYKRPELYHRIKYSLHLPQYLSWLFTHIPQTDITSIGCHTGLWDFEKQNYHEWVFAEGVIDKLAPIFPADEVVKIKLNNKQIVVGVGLHDSSAALIPYVSSFHEPFVLISTGTWCISLNSFNNEPLTAQELTSDCLSYFSYKGTAVKASRIFVGYEHEQQIKLLSEHFHLPIDHYKKMMYDANVVAGLKTQRLQIPVKSNSETYPSSSDFTHRDLSFFKNYCEAYHQLIIDIIIKQVNSTRLVINKDNVVKKIFVDGGFSNNPIYMTLLANAFPNIEVFGACVAQASALGSALAIHSHWNSKPIPLNLIELKRYGTKHAL